MIDRRTTASPAFVLTVALCGCAVGNSRSEQAWGGVPASATTSAADATGGDGETGAPADQGSTSGDPPATTGGDSSSSPPFEPDPASSSSAGDSPPVEPPPPGIEHCEVDGRVVIEAEDYAEQSGFSEIARADASGGSVMQVGDDGQLHFDIWLATGGRVYVWVRTYVPSDDSENNGMYIDLDGSTIAAPDDHAHAGTDDIYLKKIGWAWAPEWQAESGHSGPITFDTEPGVHRLTIRKRKIERPEIDMIVLELEGDEPSELGPSAGQCP